MTNTQHIPVFLNEILQQFQQVQRPVRLILDGTFGRGGHTRALLQTFPEAQIWGLDLDQHAIQYGHDHFAAEIEAGRLHLVQGNYALLAELQKGRADIPKKFDLILLDLGVSSPQLDVAERGFSFYADGPLDMRMDQSQEVTAADVINTWEEQDLARVFIEFGEVQRPFRVVRAVVHDRKTTPFTTTRQLASLIERVDGWRKKGTHPATQYFLALRLEVNQELAGVSTAIPNLIASLEPHGLLSVITFHSLEDRIVKNLFKAHLDQGKLVNKKVIKPSDEEVRQNPRARSAKLRVFEKGDREL